MCATRAPGQTAFPSAWANASAACSARDHPLHVYRRCLPSTADRRRSTHHLESQRPVERDSGLTRLGHLEYETSRTMFPRPVRHGFDQGSTCACATGSGCDPQRIELRRGRLTPKPNADREAALGVRVDCQEPRRCATLGVRLRSVLPACLGHRALFLESCCERVGAIGKRAEPQLPRDLPVACTHTANADCHVLQPRRAHALRQIDRLSSIPDAAGRIATSRGRCASRSVLEALAGSRPASTSVVIGRHQPPRDTLFANLDGFDALDAVRRLPVVGAR
jgi:hypothetical protein